MRTATVYSTSRRRKAVEGGIARLPNPTVNGQEVFSGDPVSTPPFVDDPTPGDGLVGNEDTNMDDADIASPDSPEGSAAMQQSFSETLSDKIDTLTHRIDDLLTLNKVDKLIDTLAEAFQDQPEPDVASGGPSFGGGAPSLTEPDMSHAFDDVDDGGPEVPDESGPDAGEDEEDTDTDRNATAMAKNMRRATDESGTVTDALTADEVLNDVVDQGIDFQPAQDKNATEPNSTSAEVGDNYEGSQKTYDDADDETLKPVATASAMRLADSYIRAGVLRESDRYAAIEGFSKLPKIAAEHELKALELVRKANARKTAAMRKAAMKRAALNRKARRAAQFRKAEDTQVYDLEGQQTGVITPADDGTFSFDVDGQTGDGYATESEALDAAREQTGNDDLVTSTAVASARRRAAKRRAAVKAAPRRAARSTASDARRQAARRAARGAALRRAARRAALKRASARRSSQTASNESPRRLSAANRARIKARVAAARKANATRTSNVKADPKATARRAALAAARRKAGRTPNIARTAAKADNTLALL